MTIPHERRSPVRRATQRDVAEAAGVHRTTVSRALRRERAIPVDTWQRIHAIAASLGYRAKPARQTHADRCPAARFRPPAATLAYLTNCPTRSDWKKDPAEAQTFRGARLKAATYGYRIEPHGLNEPGITGDRLGELLSARGITGVLLSTRLDPTDTLAGFPWERFAAVRLGHLPRTPALHSVRNDGRGAMRRAMEIAHALGYRRPALLLTRAQDLAVDHDWTFHFVAQQLRLGISAPLPVLYCDGLTDGTSRPSSAPTRPINEELVAQLSAGCGPDVILGLHPTTQEFLRRQAGTIPHSVACIDLQRASGQTWMAGMEPNFAAVGATAVDVLARLQRENECGIPAIATTTWVPGSWHDGASLRPIDRRLTARRGE